MTAEPELCGQPRRSDGKPCESRKSECRWHGEKGVPGRRQDAWGVRAKPLEDASPKTVDKVHRAAEMLAVGQTVPEIAAELKVAPTTVYTWITHRPELKQMAAEIRAVAQAAAVGFLSKGSSDMARTLLDIATNEKAPYGTRVRAADVALSHLTRLEDSLSLSARVAELEALLKEAGDKGW